MKRYAWIVSLSATLALACNDTPEQAATLSPPEVSPDIARSGSLNRVGRLLAQALAAPSLRSLLYEELKRSPLKESKLHLQTFLQGPGAPLHEAMALATPGGSGELSQLLSHIGSVELYLPVAEHRQQWTGGGELLIATQWAEHETPAGVDVQGRPVSLSLDAPPTLPTLVIVPAEAFDDHGVPYEKPARDTIAFSGPKLGLWANAVHTNFRMYEPWTRGDPEFEFHLQHASETERSAITCIDANYASEPYRWDMNADFYFSPFLVAGEDIFPVNTPHLVSLWEDDDTPCVIKASKDFEKETVDAVVGVVTIYNLIKNRGFTDTGAVVNVYNAAIAVRSILAGNDDYVGTSAGQTNINSANVDFYLLNDQKTPTGWIQLQWKADVAH